MPQAGQPVAQRVLVANDVEIPVRIFAPQSAGDDWLCVFEIGWPNGPARREIRGVDSVQALFLALQTIGAELYAARAAGAHDLQWLAPDAGFGFPLAPSLRDQATGDDRLI